MAEQPGISAAEAERIVSHMNKEHPDSLSAYLERYGRVPHRRAAADPKLVKFEKERMVIAYGSLGKREEFTYKFEPPMLAGQARTRLVEMHNECRKALGLSDATVRTFKLETGEGLFVAGFLMMHFVFLVPGFAPDNILTGKWVPGAFLARLPVALQGEMRMRAACIALVWVIHLLELHFSFMPLLRKFNVTGSKLRTKWIIAVALGGYPIISRFKEIAAVEVVKLQDKKSAH